MSKEVVSGIYCIRNIVNNKVYIGESIDIYRRWHEHMQDLRDGVHDNVHLQRSWNKYGEENFEFNIVEKCEENVLFEREKYWVKYYDAFKSGYNQTEGGEGCFGYKHNDKTKEKMKKIKSEQFQDIKNREKLSKAHEFESRAIYQIDFDGKVVKQWPSANWAAKILGFSQTRIYEALNHKCRKKTYGGYIWVYVDLYDPSTFNLDWYIKRNWNWTTYYQYDDNYNLIHIFQSYVEAEKLGFLNGGITKVVNTNKKYKGFYWTNKALDRREEEEYGSKKSW